MKNKEARKLVESRLDEIVSYLTSLQSKIKPVFKLNTINVFEVGVDLDATFSGSIGYTINVYPYARFPEKVLAKVEELVRQAEQNYSGSIKIMSGDPRGSTESMLTLEYLQNKQANS